MIVYFLVNILIIFLGTIFSQTLFKLSFTNSVMPMRSLGFKHDKSGIVKDTSNNYIFFILIALILLFITVFRSPDNGLSVDYGRYLQYSEIFHNLGLSEAITSSSNIGIQMEDGLIGIMTVLQPIAPGTILPFIFFTTIATIIGYFYTIRRYSPIAWLSLLIFVAFGSYYSLFNTIGQALAVGIVFGASKYLYEKGRIRKGFLKFVIIILLASLIHKSVLLMIPLYFLLTQKFNLKTLHGQLVIISLISLLTILFIFPSIVLNIGTATLFSEYNSLEGNASFLIGGTSIQTIVRPTLLIIFLLITRKYIKLEDLRDRIGVNSILLFSAINVLSLRIAIFQRLSYILIPYFIILIPLIISRIPKEKGRLRWIIISIIICLLFSLFSTLAIGDGSFKFIWQ